MSETLLALVVIHFVGDFVCQSDWMAINKSKRVDALSLHVIVYGTVLAVGSVFFAQSRDSFLAFVIANGAMHFVTDAITSRINARLWQADQRHWFFVGIGFDQVLHYAALFITADWWLA